MKIAVVTMNVKAGKCEENIAYMKSMIQQAKTQSADMIVFPQNAVSGYLLSDQWLDDVWCTYVDHFNDELVKEADDIAIVWGNIRYRNHRRFNAAFFAYQGQTHMRVRRNERCPFTNDHSYFEESDINSAITYRGNVFALNFGNEVQLADMNINLDARAYDMDTTQQLHGNVIYVNACGMQNTNSNVMIMNGGSRVLHNGHVLYHAPYFKEVMDIVYLDEVQDVSIPRESLLDALTSGIQAFDQQVFGGKQPWVVGLSGGLDSSVTCALLVHSLGADRIYGYNLATKYNRDITISNARIEAEALGIHYQEGAIEGFVSAANDTFLQEFTYNVNECETLVLENIQARSRGFLLGGFASILGGVVVNNANKVEAALGYCTLYGDSIGAISLIGDLTKVQLFDLSHMLNQAFQKEVIPESLLPTLQADTIDWKMPPSAELRDDQYDPMKWFYHDYLVDHLGHDVTIPLFMKRYLHGELEEDVMTWIRYYGLDDPRKFIQDLEWFTSTMNRNCFKRIQMPPLLSVHHKTLANEPFTQMRYDQQAYEKLKQAILTEK